MTKSKVARRQPAKADLERILEDLFVEVIDRGEQERSQRPPGYWPYNEDLDTPQEQRDKEAWVTPDLDAAYWETCVQQNDLNAIRRDVEKKLDERSLDHPSDSDLALFLRKALVTVAAAHRQDAEREKGHYAPLQHPFLGQLQETQSPAPRTDGRETVKEAFAAFASQSMTERRWNDGTFADAEKALQLFLGIMNDMPLHQVQRSDALRFRVALCKLPAMRGKSLYEGLEPLKQIERREMIQAALAADGERITVGDRTISKPEAERLAKPLTRKTVNKHLNYFVTLYKRKQDAGEFSGTSPFEKILFSKKLIRDDSETRIVWQADHLQALFTSPAWTGCQSQSHRSTPGTHVFEDERFWVPIIGLFTGMRENEICSLRIDALRRHDKAGCWIIQVVKGKTANAKRQIPVHPELENIGLLDYANAARQEGHDMLFPSLRANRRTGSLAVAFGKWFTRYRQATGLFEKGRDFHSLRHTFETLLIQNFRGDQVLMRAMMGHQQEGMDRVYFHGFEPEQTYPVIKSLDIGVDLSHLHRSRQKSRTLRLGRHA